MNLINQFKSTILIIITEIPIYKSQEIKVGILMNKDITIYWSHILLFVLIIYIILLLLILIFYILLNLYGHIRDCLKF
jgi:hypothetical protein